MNNIKSGGLLSLGSERLAGTITTSILARASGAWVSGSRLAGEEENGACYPLAGLLPGDLACSRAPSQAHLVTLQDGTGPLVCLVQLMPAVWLLLEPRLLFGWVIVPKTGRLCFGD